MIILSRPSQQGGSISPLLANIYLHYVLDLWWEKKIKRRLKGASHLVRYADDFVILFAEKSEAKEALKLIRFRLEQFGFKVAEEKTHITDLTPRGNGGGDRRRITLKQPKAYGVEDYRRALLEALPVKAEPKRGNRLGEDD